MENVKQWDFGPGHLTHTRRITTQSKKTSVYPFCSQCKPSGHIFRRRSSQYTRIKRRYDDSKRSPSETVDLFGEICVFSSFI